MQFEYYVLNYDHTNKKVIHYNIFWNTRLQEAVERDVRKYIRNPKGFKSRAFWNDEKEYTGFEGFCRELRRSIAWQELARYQYEICVGSISDENGETLEKWDCFQQCEPNIEMIAREVLYQYRKWRKENGK